MPGLLVGHGAGSNRKRHDAFCRTACAAGFVVLAFDFRGHGESGGLADGPLEMDILAAAAFLRNRPGVRPDQVCYRGSSMGGFYGLKAATSEQFAALVLLCPASEQVILDAISKGDAESPDPPQAPQPPASLPPGTRTSRRDPAGQPPRWDIDRLRQYFLEQDSAYLAGQVACPVLIVHAREDTVVPFNHSLVLARHLKTETALLALPGGTHTTAQHDPHVHELTVSWLREQLSRSRTGSLQTASRAANRL
ncbi:MAG: alpha/beta fold hydrolase [Thermoleophilia bacterium]|nr:alpha/beta fold hydrolase [Thermoleophilia bacterium]